MGNLIILVKYEMWVDRSVKKFTKMFDDKKDLHFVFDCLRDTRSRHWMEYV